MSLDRYNEKRDFKKTPEPAGSVVKNKGALRFVIQKHAATRLHYDFRLELGGVLLSWAVPKGPSLNPADKRLAVHVEDHPVQYGSFEGIIPHGEYGGGSVVVWDHGTWHPEGDAEADYKRGNLKFRLEGEKCRGSYALVRMHGPRSENGKNWLLLKHADEHASDDGERLVRDQPESVQTGRTVEEVAAKPDKAWHSNRGGHKGGEKVLSAEESKSLARKPRPAKATAAAEDADPEDIARRRLGLPPRAAARTTAKKTAKKAAKKATRKKSAAKKTIHEGHRQEDRQQSLGNEGHRKKDRDQGHREEDRHEGRHEGLDQGLRKEGLDQGQREEDRDQGHREEDRWQGHRQEDRGQENREQASVRRGACSRRSCDAGPRPPRAIAPAREDRPRARHAGRGRSPGPGVATRGQVRRLPPGRAHRRRAGRPADAWRGGLEPALPVAGRGPPGARQRRPGDPRRRARAPRLRRCHALRRAAKGALRGAPPVARVLRVRRAAPAGPRPARPPARPAQAGARRPAAAREEARPGALIGAHRRARRAADHPRVPDRARRA